MNSIYFKSIKHQSNTITFSREEDVFFATGEGVDTWTDKTITFQKAKLDAFDIKLQFGRGDSDITLSLSRIVHQIRLFLSLYDEPHQEIYSIQQIHITNYHKQYKNNRSFTKYYDCLYNFHL